MENEIEKLDNYSKITLATGAINYLAFRIEYARADMCKSRDQFDIDQTKELEAELNRISVELSDIIRRLGKFTTETHDLACGIDAKTMHPIFDVLCNANDDVDVFGVIVKEDFSAQKV